MRILDCDNKAATCNVANHTFSLPLYTLDYLK